MFQGGSASRGRTPVLIVVVDTGGAWLGLDLLGDFYGVAHSLLDFFRHGLVLAEQEILPFAELVDIDCVVLPKQDLGKVLEDDLEVLVAEPEYHGLGQFHELSNVELHGGIGRLLLVLQPFSSEALLMVHLCLVQIPLGTEFLVKMQNDLHFLSQCGICVANVIDLSGCLFELLVDFEIFNFRETTVANEAG